MGAAGGAAFERGTGQDTTRVVATAGGRDRSSHRSAKATRQVVEPFSLVLVMEERHRQMMRETYPELADRIYLLKEMGDGTGDVHDPIGTDIVNYRAMADEVNSILTKGLARIRELAEDRNEELPQPKIQALPK